MNAATSEYANEFRRRLLYVSGAYPTIWQLPNPLKIYEYRTLIEGAHFERGARVVEIGSGRGLAAQLLARRGWHVVGVDPNDKQMSNARRELRFSRMRSRVTFVRGTLNDLSDTTASYDGAFSFSVLEHIAPLEQTLARLRDLLRPGAAFHLTVDTLANVTDRSLVERHRSEYYVERYFTHDSLRSTLENAGFEVEYVDDLLRSTLAVDLLRQYIETRVALAPPKTRRRGYQELAAAERAATGPGLMIICRARRR